MEVLVHFDPRPDYDRAKATLRNAGVLGVRIEMGARLITLRGDVKLAPAAAGAHAVAGSGRCGRRAGQRGRVGTD